MGAIDRDSLLRAASLIGLLASGWQPGKAEFDDARYVERWAVIPSDNGAPFRLIGTAWSLPLRSEPIVGTLLAIDAVACWARLWNEWILISAPLAGSPAIDVAAIQDAASFWVDTQLRRSPA